MPRLRVSKNDPERSPLRRVAVLVDTSSTWGRRIIVGIHNFARERQRWQLLVEMRGLEEDLEVAHGWKGDGVIARVATPERVRHLQSLRLPVVNVSGIELAGATFPRVTTDMRAVAELAVAHFVERGIEHFAYFSLLGLSYVVAQQDAFVNEVRRAGHECALYGVGTHSGAEPDWSLDLRKLAQWLQRLPKPVAIFTWNASSAREVLFGCQAAGVRVPDEVAVLSGSDDDLLCEISDVPISAVMVAAEQIGFEAAKLLDQLMRKESAGTRATVVKPWRIVTRQSTDMLAVRDAALAKALRFIRGHASELIQVSDVARQAGLSRRVMERRFLSVLGRTPAEEIRRVHLEQARWLLEQTDLPIPKVAEASGFGSAQYMAYVFRTVLKLSPLQHRKQVQSKTRPKIT